MAGQKKSSLGTISAPPSSVEGGIIYLVEVVNGSAGGEVHDEFSGGFVVVLIVLIKPGFMLQQSSQLSKLLVHAANDIAILKAVWQEDIEGGSM